jgi:hypothetical protein
MAESRDNKPSINWLAADLDREWKKFKQHCMFTFNWTPAGDDTPAENETIAGVCNKYGTYVAPKRNEI